MNMRLSTGALILLATASVAALAVEANDGEDTQGAAEANQGKVGKFKLPEVFNFDKYKQMFRKDYRSHSEDSARSKNYFGRAFGVFISCVKYVWKKSTSYSSINERSDWTEKERRSTFTYPVDRRELLDEKFADDEADSDSSNEIDENPAVELEEVEETLAEVVSQREQNPEYAKIAAELENTASGREQRQGGAEERREVSLDELLIEEPEEKSVSSADDEEQLSIIGGGRDSPPVAEEMSTVEWAKIIAHKGKSYLSRIVNTLLSTFKKNPLANLVLARNTDEADLSRPDEVFLDYRDSGCIHRAKDQGKCGSCYIFSSTALYEYHQCKQSGQLVPFSEQYIIDCGPRTKMNGCNGGHEDQVGKFIELFGLEQQHDYPYRAKQGECPYEADVPNRLLGNTRANQPQIKYLPKFFLGVWNRKKIDETLERYGPLVVGIMVSDEFHDYGGGVHRLNGCRWFSGHSMLIVGHGIQEGLEYWLVRNSFGPYWGQQGYYKLSKGIPKRCILSVGYADPKFNGSVSSRSIEKAAHKAKLQNKQMIKRFKESFGV